MRNDNGPFPEIEVDRLEPGSARIGDVGGEDLLTIATQLEDLAIEPQSGIDGPDHRLLTAPLVSR